MRPPLRIAARVWLRTSAWPWVRDALQFAGYAFIVVGAVVASAAFWGRVFGVPLLGG